MNGENPWRRHLRLMPGDERLANELRAIRAKDSTQLWFHGREPYFDVFFEVAKSAVNAGVGAANDVIRAASEEASGANAGAHSTNDVAGVSDAAGVNDATVANDATGVANEDGVEILWFQFTLRGCALTWTPTSLNAGFTHECEVSSSTSPASHFIESARNPRALAALVAELLAPRAQEPLFAAIRRLLLN